MNCCKICWIYCRSVLILSNQKVSEVTSETLVLYVKSNSDHNYDWNMSYRAYHISMRRGQCRLCPKTLPNTPQNYGKEEEEKKKDKVVHFSYICHPIYWLILSIVLYFVVIVARNLNKCVKTEILHWLNNWPFHPAFLGSEQRKSNGCAAMVGPCHELRPGWGPKANQQVINQDPRSLCLIAFLLQHPQLCSQGNCGTPAEVQGFWERGRTFCYHMLLSFWSNDWQNDWMTSLYHLSARTVQILQLTDVSTSGQWLPQASWCVI